MIDQQPEPAGGSLLRPSARVRTVAKMLEWDESQVRRAVDSGGLEAYRVGKRGIRIYIDSVRVYQESRNIAPTKKTILAKSARTRISTRAHRAAMEELRARGIL